MKVEWNDPKEFPDVLSDAGNGFSCDVFIYCKSTNERTVGWFDYNQHKWNFLINGSIGKKWKWRYFNDKIDKY
jgi:hypothetical protein